MNQSPKEIRNIANLYGSIYTNKDVLDEEIQELKLFMIEWYNSLVENGLVKGEYFDEEVLLDEDIWSQIATKGPKVVNTAIKVLKQATGYGTKPTTKLGTAVRIGQQAATPLLVTDAGGVRTRLQRGTVAGVNAAMKDPKPKPYADSFDPYDVIKGHLIDEGYADTEEAAEAIMANMSEEWRHSILVEDPIQDYRDMKRSQENATGMRGPELSHSSKGPKSPGSATQRTKPQPRGREFTNPPS
jgi:hypothetical protein